MNCYEWSKKITGSFSVSFSVDYETGTGEDKVSIKGDHEFTHGPLYTSWTRRELQCVRSPLPPNNDNSYLLRSTNLCEGRATLEGVLSPIDTMTITTTVGSFPPQTEEATLFWWDRSTDGIWKPSDTIFPLGIVYPKWTNDPYSVAKRNLIDLVRSREQKYYGIDFVYVGSSLPPPQDYPPSCPLFKWPKTGDTDTWTDGEFKKTATVNYNFTAT
jgi:hypothetical protein